MSALEALGTTSNIITILDTSIKVFQTIATIATSLVQYSERTSSIIRQCSFDTETIKNIINIFHANPRLLDGDSDRNNTENVFYQLQISLFKVKSRLEPFREGTLSKRLLWSVAIEKVAVEVEKDLFQWSQRLYMRLSILLSQFRGSLSSQQISPLLRIPEVVSQYRMNELVTKANAVEPSDLRKDADSVTLEGDPSSRMMGTMQDGQKVLVEFRPYEDSSDAKIRDKAEADTAQLAAILRNANPSWMNILHCRGYYHDQARSRFALLFSVPTGITAPNDFVFLNKLIATQRRYSLTKRLQIARRIAAAVFVVHGVQWVHKRIQSRNVMICLRGDLSSEAYVTGFEESRYKHGISDGSEFDNWQERLYQHPDRQANQGNAYYVPAYDIYSLGVVLLEIARWKMFESEVDREGRPIFARSDPTQTRRRIARYLDGISHNVGESFARIVDDCLGVDRSKGIELMGDVLTRLEQLSEV